MARRGVGRTARTEDCPWRCRLCCGGRLQLDADGSLGRFLEASPLRRWTDGLYESQYINVADPITVSWQNSLCYPQGTPSAAWQHCWYGLKMAQLQRGLHLARG